jgi:hypothetical protein
MTPDEQMLAVVNANLLTIRSGWDKACKASGHTDFIALVEPGLMNTSVLIMSRGTGLTFLEQEWNVDPEDLKPMSQPATGERGMFIVIRFKDRICVESISMAKYVTNFPSITSNSFDSN